MAKLNNAVTGSTSSASVPRRNSFILPGKHYVFGMMIVSGRFLFLCSKFLLSEVQKSEPTGSVDRTKCYLLAMRSINFVCPCSSLFTCEGVAIPICSYWNINQTSRSVYACQWLKKQLFVISEVYPLDEIL